MSSHQGSGDKSEVERMSEGDREEEGECRERMRGREITFERGR